MTLNLPILAREIHAASPAEIAETLSQISSFLNGLSCAEQGNNEFWQSYTNPANSAVTRLWLRYVDRMRATERGEVRS